MRLASFLLVVALFALTRITVTLAEDPFPSCDADKHEGCRGSAMQRLGKARELIKQIDFNVEWAAVREGIVSACGLKVKPSTGHCFEDFNHVDCCTMVDRHTHRTNQKSQVVGMHEQNQLGAHITDGSTQVKTG